MSEGDKPGSSPVRVRILVSGRVQGVGFRYAAVREGRRLNLRGWVRNMPDGRVEVVAEGPENAVQKMVTWCHAGPPAALVTAVQHARIEMNEHLEGFGVRW